MAPQQKAVPSRFGSAWRVGLTEADRQALAEDENLSVDPPVLPPVTLGVAASLPRPPSPPPGTSPLARREE